MEKKKYFCVECRKDVDVNVERKKKSTNIKGIEYTYEGKNACCSECGEYVYVEEINDFNVKALNDAYRKYNGIISLEDIKGIPEKYDIRKRPLSMLLGWGEHTFSRYYDGDMPTKQYSDTLIQIYENPQFFLKILEANKDKINSSAYEKCKKKIKSILEVELRDKVSIDLVADYILYLCEDVTPLALQKTLYYVQGFSYAFCNSFLFEEECQAWVHGPVYPEIYNRYKDYRFESINEVIDSDFSTLSAFDKEIIENVAKYFCCYSGKTLEKFTHSETPWLSAREGLLVGEKTNKVINKNVISEYFMNLKKKYNMLNPIDIRCYAKDMFTQI